MLRTDISLSHLGLDFSIDITLSAPHFCSLRYVSIQSLNLVSIFSLCIATRTLFLTHFAFHSNGPHIIPFLDRIDTGSTPSRTDPSHMHISLPLTRRMGSKKYNSRLAPSSLQLVTLLPYFSSQVAFSLFLTRRLSFVPRNRCPQRPASTPSRSRLVSLLSLWNQCPRRLVSRSLSDSPCSFGPLSCSQSTLPLRRSFSSAATNYI